MIGRLKRSTKERCPVCDKILQIRVRDVRMMRKGIEVIVPEDYIACSNKNCFYERYIEQKRRRILGEENLIP